MNINKKKCQHKINYLHVYPSYMIIAILVHGSCTRLIALTLNGFGCSTSPRS